MVVAVAVYGSASGSGSVQSFVVVVPFEVCSNTSHFYKNHSNMVHHLR